MQKSSWQPAKDSNFIIFILVTEILLNFFHLKHVQDLNVTGKSLCMWSNLIDKRSWLHPYSVCTLFKSVITKTSIIETMKPI